MFNLLFSTVLGGHMHAVTVQNGTDASICRIELTVVIARWAREDTLHFVNSQLHLLSGEQTTYAITEAEPMTRIASAEVTGYEYCEPSTPIDEVWV